MNAISRRLAGATLLGLAFVATAAPAAWSQATSPDQPITGISSVTRYSSEARVSAIDIAARTITLTQSDGKTVQRKVGEAAQNLGLIKLGDVVSVTYEQRTSFVLSGPKAATPDDHQAARVVATQTNNSAGALVASTELANWTVVRTDVAANTISLVDPAGGQVLTFDVTTSTGRLALPRVKPGDNLTAVETQIGVITITPKT
jgi:hypothetical protein